MKKRKILSAILVVSLLVMVACWIETAMKWIQLADDMLDGLQSAVQSLVDEDAIDSNQAKVIIDPAKKARENLNVAHKLLSQYKEQKDKTQLSKVHAALDAVEANLAELLNALNVLNPDLRQEVEGILKLVKEAVNIASSIVPTLGPDDRLRHAEPAIKPRPMKDVKSDYNRVVTTPTGNPQVDRAFAGAVLR